MSSLEQDVVDLCRAARAAAPALARASTAEKNAALARGRQGARARTGELVAANAEDVEAARAAGVAPAFLDRLTLTPPRIDAMAVGLEQIAALPDPVGEEISRWSRPNGLDIQQVRVPLGVIGIIYESRPNVTADAAGLCLKSGNAVVLRGGSEAFRTNCLIADVLRDAATTIPRDAIALVRSTDRTAVSVLLQQDELIDVIIPRGGEELIRAITEGSRIPVIQHLNGVCQLYVDRAADHGARRAALPERQDAASRRLQRDREPARAPRRRRQVPARGRGQADGCRRRAPRLPGDGAPGPGHEARDRRRLGHRVSRPRARGEGGRLGSTTRSPSFAATARASPTRSSRQIRPRPIASPPRSIRPPSS